MKDWRINRRLSLVPQENAEKKKSGQIEVEIEALIAFNVFKRVVLLLEGEFNLLGLVFKMTMGLQYFVKHISNPSHCNYVPFTVVFKLLWFVQCAPSKKTFVFYTAEYN